MTVSGETIQYGDGSVSNTLNSTAFIAARTMNRSPLKYGFKNTSNILPVTPSTVSSMGNMWTRLPYLTSGQC
ncbi:hypothetical protein DERP_001287 [Dermatophagoides pteronyssinus]|uniref:Uncharacterized protein n=1 Tax=Dermatophagoides pteronyssinus TaxID=6956 RepID=A0ABQ8JE70_DERPT|nr:hypothetical protein DERP_001287 [Dermatophagoides pteronyssinus]